MKRILLFACFCLTVLPGWAQAAMDRHYGLQKTSLYEDGCFAPCMCPVLIRDDLRGKFSLVPAGSQDGYDVYLVNNVQWMVTLSNGSTTMIRGSGTYLSSMTYKLQRLEMDLIVGDQSVEHYDSGLVQVRVPLPELSIVISKNGMYCRDTVFTLDAAPASNDVRPPKLQFEDEGMDKGASTTWGRLKKLWTP